METAGVVLAVLPLLFNGLTGLAHAAGTFDKLRKPGKEYGRYGMNLKREHSIYRNTITELLEGIVKDDDDKQAMMLNGRSPLWAHYDLDLQKRLSQSYDVFLATIEEIEEELQDLVRKLKLKPLTDDQHVSSKDFSSQYASSEDFCTKEWRRFKLAFNAEAYKEIYDRIQDLNSFLRNTIQQSLRLEKSRHRHHSIGSKHIAKIRQLREHARNIHHSVTGCWACDCHHQIALRVSAKSTPSIDIMSWRLDIEDPKEVNVHVLELEPANTRTATVLAGPSQPFDSANTIASTVLSSQKPIKWLLPEENKLNQTMSAATNNQNTLLSTRIDDLCTALKFQASRSSELGYLDVKDDHDWRCRVRYLEMQTPKMTRETIADLLQRNAVSGSALQVVFSRRERLATAATLAVSVLFLDGSWLKPVFNNTQVTLKRPSLSRQGEVSELSFSWVIGIKSHIDTEIEKRAVKLKMQRKTAVLFALAIALIELSLGGPFELMKTDDERVEGFISGNIMAASRLLPRVEDASGFEYHEVVRKCLDCPFDIREPSMDNDKFVEVYIEEIAKPLIKDYKQFIGFT